MASVQVRAVQVTCISHLVAVQKVAQNAYLIINSPSLYRAKCHRGTLRLSSKFMVSSLTRRCRHTKRNRSCVFQALSFQDVAAENDSEGSDAIVPPAHSVEVPKFLRQKDVGRLLLDSVHGFQRMNRNLKEQGPLQYTKRLLQDLHHSMENFDATGFSTQISRLQSSKVAEFWMNTEPCVKWPLLLFLSSYIAVAASFGFDVSKDLLPLLVVGPLATSFYIKSWIQFSMLFTGFVKRTEPTIKALSKHTSQLYMDARTGKLRENLKENIEHSIKERWLAFALYFESGQARSDFKRILLEFLSWSYEKFLDFLDYVWPTWRLFKRTLLGMF